MPRVNSKRRVRQPLRSPHEMHDDDAPDSEPESVTTKMSPHVPTSVHAGAALFTRAAVAGAPTAALQPPPTPSRATAKRASRRSSVVALASATPAVSTRKGRRRGRPRKPLVKEEGDEETLAVDHGVESPPDALILRERRKLAASMGGAQGVSPMEEDTKVKRQPRTPKSNVTLEQRLKRTELSQEKIAKIIKGLYEEQERDDREMYDIKTQTVKETTTCEMSDVVDELDSMALRRLLTYGEVSVESVASTLIPFLRLRADDVFYDLGCGTGKIVLQVAMQTPCMVAKGIELMQNRVLEGAKAMERLEEMNLLALNDKEIKIIHGDILKPPETARMLEATVVFINNVCFGPELMLKVMDMLTLMPNLRRIITLRKICERHRPHKCARAGNFCVEYVHPPEEAEIMVSWASKTSIYLYEKLDFSVAQLAEKLQVPVQQA